MFPHWTTNSWHCDYHKPRSPTQPRRSLAGLLAHPPPRTPTHLLVLSKTCLYKHIESGLTGKASRRFFEHNCHCFKHREERGTCARLCACVRARVWGWVGCARGGGRAFDIQRENIAAWNGINHLQSLIVFQKEKKHTPRPRIAAFFSLVFVIFKKIARLIWPNWKAAAPMRLVQRRFQISQHPPPSLLLMLLLLAVPAAHSFPSTHRLLALPILQYLPSGNIQLLILAQ